MESSGNGILSRVGERVLTLVVVAALVGLGVAIWRMDPAVRGAIASGIWRTIIWIAIVAAAPWSARLVIRRVLEVGSNSAGLALVTVFVVIDAAAGMILIGGLPNGGWGWTAALTALTLAASYNYLVAEYLADRYGGL